MRNKRGQVTLFIILGIVVILIIAIAIFLISEHRKKIDNKIYEEPYAARLAPIHNDIVFCTESLGKEAIVKIGETGGFLDINPLLYNYNSFYAYNNNALELFPDSGVVIPYWGYISDEPSCRDCAYIQNIPPLVGDKGETVQNSLETYVERNMISCLGNFSAYKADLEIKYEKLPVCNVEIRDENVFFGIDWKIEVKFPDKTIDTMSKFQGTVDVRLKKIYEYAMSIIFQMEMMDESRAFEYMTKDLISFYSFGGEDAVIPPISGPTTFEFGSPKMWLQMNVQDTLKNAVAETVPYMQITGTKDSFILFTNDSIKSNFYSNFQNVIYYDDDFSSQVRVRFNYYPIWPFYANVWPNGGAVILPETIVMKLWVLKVTTTKYNFYYDVSYPVLVTLEDDSAFEGEGYAFNFPFEVNLKNNNPYSNNTIKMEDFMVDEEEEDMGYGQRTVPVNISVINGYTNIPAENISISYMCINNEYLVGTSKITKTNPNAMIESYIPPCIGGYFYVDIEGYAEGTVFADSSLEEPIVLDFRVYPAKIINLEIRKKEFEPTNSDNILEVTDEYLAMLAENGEDVKVLDELKTTKYITSSEINRGWTLSSPEQPGESILNTDTDEEVILMMTEVKADGGLGNVVFFNSNSSENLISLVPGKFRLQIVSTVKMGEGRDMMNFTIPKRAMINNGDYSFINKTVIEKTMYVGGIIIDESTIGYITITPSDLHTKSSFIVYYPSFNLTDVKVIEDLSVLNLIQNVTESHPMNFMPTFE